MYSLVLFEVRRFARYVKTHVGLSLITYSHYFLHFCLVTFFNGFKKPGGVIVISDTPITMLAVADCIQNDRTETPAVFIMMQNVAVYHQMPVPGHHVDIHYHSRSSKVAAMFDSSSITGSTTAFSLFKRAFCFVLV